MKTKKAAQSSVDIGNLSIPDAEEIIEQALNELAFSPDPGLARALQFPGASGLPGYRGAMRRKRPQQAPQRFGGYVVARGR